MNAKSVTLAGLVAASVIAAGILVLKTNVPLVPCSVTATVVHLMPLKSNVPQGFTLPVAAPGAIPKAFYHVAYFNVNSWSLANPGNPIPAQFVMSDHAPCPVSKGPVKACCDCDQGPTNDAEWQNQDGSGFVTTDWHRGDGGSLGRGQNMVLASGGSIHFGQQLNPDGSGKVLGQGYPMASVLTSTGRKIAYFASQLQNEQNLYKVDVTSVTGSGTSPPIVGGIAANWARLRFLKVGITGPTTYLFGLGTDGVLKGAVVNGDGTLSPVPSDLPGPVPLDMDVVYSNSVFTFYLLYTSTLGVVRFTPSTQSFQLLQTNTINANSVAIRSQMNGANPVNAIERKIGPGQPNIWELRSQGQLLLTFPSANQFGQEFVFFIPPGSKSAYAYYPSSKPANSDGSGSLTSVTASLSCAP